MAPTARGQRKPHAKSSGLSLERFIQGKAQRTKADAKSKKKVIIHKALRKRAYEKVKKQGGGDNDADGDEEPTSFYDRFFKELKQGDGDKDGGKKAVHMDIKPDPFFKAKKKAEIVKAEKQKSREEKQQRQAEMEKKLNDRKKRHVKLSVRTASGQPVVKNRIKDILAKLQSEKN